MGILGSFLGRVVTLGVAAAVGFIAGGPVGAGLAMSNAAVAAHTAGLVGLLAPL
jgi:hypothetical protein